MWIVRSYDPADEARVVALWDEVFGYGEARNDPSKVIRAKLRWDDRLLVAAKGAEVLGTLMFGFDGHRGWLYRMAVAPSARRRGIGRALVRVAEAQLRDVGCEKVNLQLHATNEAGARFWQAVGYGREARISMGKELGTLTHDPRDAGC